MIDYAKIPDRILGGIQRWVLHGTRAGDFLTAVLCNDLAGACHYADEECIAALPHIVGYLWNRCPMACYGDRERAGKWGARGGFRGQNAADDDWDFTCGTMVKRQHTSPVVVRGEPLNKPAHDRIESIPQADLDRPITDSEGRPIDDCDVPREGDK